MHGFRDNEVLLQAGYDVIVISPQRSLYAILHNGFWKNDPDFIFIFIWHLLSILNGLDVIWAKLPPKRQMIEKHLLAGNTFLRQTASIEPLCVKLSQVRKKKKGCKAERQAGRKEEKSQEVYISRMCGATPSGRIPTKLGTSVRLTDVIKRANNSIVITWEVSELWGVEVSMLP